MHRLLSATREAGLDTLRFFHDIPAVELALWLAAGCFLGWNGVQFLVAGHFLFLFVDQFSFSMLVHRIINGRVPLPFYLLTALIIPLFWSLRAILEARLLVRLGDGEPVPSLRRGLRFALVSSLYLGGFAAGLTGAFLVPWMVHLIFRAYPADYAFSLFNSLVFAGIETFLFWGLFTTWLVDFVLPQRERGFTQACLESYRRFRRHPLDVLYVYLIRLISLAASVAAGVMVIRHLLFPLVVLVALHLHQTPFKTFDLYLGRWALNLGQLVVAGLFILMCASPVYLPFWVFQRHLIRRVFGDRYPEFR